MGDNSFFKRKIVAINVGLKSFGDGVREQDIKVAQVNWRPGVNKEIKNLLAKVL